MPLSGFQGETFRKRPVNVLCVFARLREISSLPFLSPRRQDAKHLRYLMLWMALGVRAIASLLEATVERIVQSAPCSQGLLCLFGKLDANEVRFRVQIILTRFIQDPNVSVPGSLLIGDDLVNLALFKVLAVIVPHAERELLECWLCCHGFSRGTSCS